MDASDAAAVLARARRGDDDAFGALVQQHSHRAFVLALRMTGNEQDAEDIVQESFLRAYRQIGRFEARANFGTWLYRIVVNCAVDRLRTRPKGRLTGIDALLGETAVESRPGPDRLAASEEIGRKVRDALDALTPLERAAFTLRHYEGLSIAEIGGILNLGTSAAKHGVFRAVRKLRAALAPLHAAASE